MTSELVQEVVNQFLSRKADIVKLKPYKWEVGDTKRILTPNQMKVWNLYQNTYSDIGAHVPNINTFLSEYTMMWLIDVDGDTTPDAFIAYKKTLFGRKLGLVGTDGSREAKRALALKMAQILKSVGWYAEVSGRPKDFCETVGVPKVTDEIDVRSIIRHKIIWLGDGNYMRAIGPLGMHEKAIFGRPVL